MSTSQHGADASIARLAAAQHGVVDLAALRAAGLRIGAINARVRAGRLHRLHRGVFAVGHVSLSREGRWLAAVLALGEGAALSHVSAAALWELRFGSSSVIHVTVPTASGHARRRGIVVHRSVTLRPGEDVTRRDGIPVTTVSRTLLDLAGMLADGPLMRAVERALALRLFDLADLQRSIDAHPVRPGATRLARIVAGVHDEPPVTRRELEARMRDLCAEHALPAPAVNAVVEGYEVDFLWRAQRLIVETDGHEHHGTRTAFEQDRARDALLTVRGYRVVRFTYRQLVDGPRAVAGMLDELLRRRSA